MKIDRFSKQGGGQVATAMVALRRWGLKTKYIGKVGGDELGEFSLDSVRKELVDTSGVTVESNAYSQFAVILVERSSGDRTILWDRDARLMYRDGELRKEDICSGKILHLEGHDVRAAIRSARWAREADLREGIDGSTITITNDYEFELLRNHLHMDEVAFLNCAQVLIITRGPDGSTILTREQRYEVPAVLTARPIDPTGVGDAYRAGLIRGMALGLPWDTIGRVAALAATYVLENHGPQNHQYTREEFTQRYRTQFGNCGLSGL